ncbi:hypothetical protein [Streptomyces celluloflavus]|uniref:hypothetical protein n=1 Tax=Streptomyces celluloflavus TaxID=58344 RepID=UPI00365EC58D
MTTATRKARTAKSGNSDQSTDPRLDPAELVHYSPEQVATWLPFTARTLRDKANARLIPHSQAGGRISFRLAHIREIAAMYEVRPLSERSS